MAKRPGLTLAALKSRLADGRIAPVYLITGTESFLADEAMRSIAAAIKAKAGDYARSYYHGDEADLATILGLLRTMDLFSPNRLVIVSPADRFVQRHPAPLAGYASAPPPHAFLVLVVAKADARKKLTKAVESAGGLVACRQVYPRDIVPWIMARVKAMNRQIESAAAARLAEFLGTDLGTIAGELDKLATYLGDRKKITAADVDAVSLRDRSRVVFEVTDAIGRRRPGEVLTILNGLLESGENALKILFWVSRHMRQLWTAKELINRGQAPMAGAQHDAYFPFVEQFLAQVDTFSVGELRRNCSALTRCEATLKSSGMDERILLETTFVRLLRRGEKAAAARAV